MELRPTAAEDLPELHEVFCSAIGELYHRHNLDAPSPPLDVFRLQHGHVLEHDPRRCRVAVEDGRLVAYAAALARGDSWFLCSLFVRPDAHGRGVGTALLESVWGESYAQRRTLTDAIQPVSNGLYARRGLVPATPALHLGGRPTAMPDRSLEAADPDADALRALDLAAYGFDRAPDHVYWARHARRRLWLRKGRPAAYAYVFPDGRIGPLAGASDADAAAALTSELARLDRASLVVPGSCTDVVAAAIACGLRFVRVPGLLLLSRGTAPPRGLVVSSYTLY